MGWCAELGPEIQAGCGYSMVAHHDHCSCEHCGAVCQGMFPACKTVWAAGPKPLIVRVGRDRAQAPNGRPADDDEDGRVPLEQSTTEPGDAGATMPQISVVTAVSPPIGGVPAQPALQAPVRSPQVVPDPRLEETVRQLQTASNDVAASIHVRLDELEDRFQQLQADAAVQSAGSLQVQLSEVQRALADLRQQGSYLERVLSGLRGDVASILVLERQASHR